MQIQIGVLVHSGPHHLVENELVLAMIVYGLTRQGLELTIYRTQSKHTYHYSTDEVQI
jgi:hypothetical protein